MDWSRQTVRAGWRLVPINRPCESPMRRTNALFAAKGLDGALWRWYNKRAGRDDAAVSFSPPFGLGAARQFALMAARFSICRPCESPMRRANALFAAKGLDGASWRWYNKRAGRDDAAVELLPSEMDWSRQSVRAGWRLTSLFVALVVAHCSQYKRDDHNDQRQ